MKYYLIKKYISKNTKKIKKNMINIDFKFEKLKNIQK